MQQIEMILLHEIAHVRRWDNFFNVLQRCIEAFLFFHPAVWVISSWVRAEREHCCDDFVVRRTGDSKSYAELLALLAAKTAKLAAPSLSFKKAPPLPSSQMARHAVLSRIQRLVKKEEQPMQVSGKLLAFVLTPVVLAIALVAIGDHGDANGQDDTRKPKKESTTQPARSTKDDIQVDNCLLSIIDRVRLAAGKDGLVDMIEIEPGDQVKKGQIIVSLDNRIARAALATAKKVASNDIQIRYAIKALQVAKFEYEVMLNAYKKLPNTVPQAEVGNLSLRVARGELQIEQAETEMAIAKLEYEQARNEAEALLVISPISGIVTKVNKRKGEAVQAGETIVEVVNTDRIRVNGFLKSDQRLKVKRGDKVTVYMTDQNGKPTNQGFEGKITFVDVEIAPVVRTVKVAAEISNVKNTLAGGMTARMVIHGSRDE
jgi:RND family efflux transporter MFP subunit